MDKQLEIKVKEFAKKVRLTQMEMFKTLGFGHIGGALSATDIIGLLYEGVMNYKPEDPSS